MTDLLVQRFTAADALLREWETAWSEPPFRSWRLAWEEDIPDLSRALRGLSEAQLKELEDHPGRSRRFIARWLPRVADQAARLEPGEIPPIRNTTLSEEGIPERKRRQIRAFVDRLPWQDLPILEWCSGKGHLGRTLQRATGQPVRCIERDERLAHRGRQIAEESDQPIDFAVLDALGPDAAGAVQSAQLACALHACGELHVRLLQLAIGARTQAVAVSPCCYHLYASDGHEPLSATAAASTLSLDRDRIRLALQETVTASPAARGRRMKLAQWRLGFDALQREIRGVDEYLPVPSLSNRAGGGFESFVRWAAARKSLDLPSAVDFDRYEDLGWERLGETRRLSIFRHLFRRPLEMWLVLDRALFLAENGYTVSVGTFCEREITPRNLLIRASLA